MFGRFIKSAMSPMQGMNKILGGDFKGGAGDMIFGPDAYYSKFWQKKTGLRSPQQEIGFDMPEMGDQVGYGDYSQGMGASGMSGNPYAALRGRGF